jgi:hypothetical protein
MKTPATGGASMVELIQFALKPLSDITDFIKAILYQ